MEQSHRRHRLHLECPRDQSLGWLIFFLPFINDVPECVSSDCRLFADDSVIYSPISSSTDCQQKDPNHLTEWEERWWMRYNPDKCHDLRLFQKDKHYLSLYITSLVIVIYWSWQINSKKLLCNFEFSFNWKSVFATRGAPGIFCWSVARLLGQKSYK